MRQLVSTALVALIVAALTAVTVSAVAQAPAEPAVTTAALDADTVDGLSAVKATTQKAKRAGKLVATDAQGFLPSNIVKAKWGLIADKPAGLADGVDNEGVTQVRLGTYRVAQEVPAGGWHYIDVPCPDGWRATGGGFYGVWSTDQVEASEPVDANMGWHFEVTTAAGASPHVITVKVICLTTEPASALSTAKVRSARGQ